jgi:hypothetical protein
VQRIYVCRDDKYLYWRVDFFEINPIWKSPQAKNGAQFTLSIDNLENYKDLILNVYSRPGNNQTSSGMGIYDAIEHQWTPLGDDIISQKQTKTMCVARIDLARISKYCNVPLQMNYELSGRTRDGYQENTVKGLLGFVDFSK